MAVTDDIVATYRRPRHVLRRLLAAEAHEARPLSYLIAAMIVVYIAQWPALSRVDVLAGPDSPVPFAQRMMAAMLGVFALLPAFYIVAALSHIAARALGGKGSYYAARLAMFWAFLAVTPLMLLRGLVAGFIGPSPALTATGLAALAVFIWFWLSGLAAAEWGE